MQLPQAVPPPELHGDEAADATLLRFVDVNLPARAGRRTRREDIELIQLARDVVFFPTVLGENFADASSVALRVVKHEVDQLPPSVVARASTLKLTQHTYLRAASPPQRSRQDEPSKTYQLPLVHDSVSSALAPNG